MSATRDRYFFILNLEEVSQRVSLSRSAIYELIDACDFPKPVALTRQRKGWLVNEIDAWIARRVEERDAPDTRGPVE